MDNRFFSVGKGKWNLHVEIKKKEKMFYKVVIK